MSSEDKGLEPQNATIGRLRRERDEWERKYRDLRDEVEEAGMTRMQKAARHIASAGFNHPNEGRSDAAIAERYKKRNALLKGDGGE